jgi:hypothetical protein
MVICTCYFILDCQILRTICDIFAYRLIIDGVTHGLVYKINVMHRRGAKHWGNTQTSFHEGCNTFQALENKFKDSKRLE